MHAELIEQLKKWQAGHLPASTEWWEVVPAQMRDQLDKKEVERQGLIWEIFRSEQEYVLNLQAGLNVSHPLPCARDQPQPVVSGVLMLSFTIV